MAAFVAGVGYRLTRVRSAEESGIDHSELLLVDEVGVLAANFVWFMLGGAVLLVFASGIDWGVVLLALLALTLIRNAAGIRIPSMGSSVLRRDRVLIGSLDSGAAPPRSSSGFSRTTPCPTMRARSCCRSWS